MKPSLTKYNKKAHGAIVQFFTKKGYYPSSKELGEKIGIATQNAHRQIVKLKQFKCITTNSQGRIISAHPIA